MSGNDENYLGYTSKSRERNGLMVGGDGSTILYHGHQLLCLIQCVYDLAFLFYRAAEMKGRGYGVIDVPAQVEKLHIIMHPWEVQWKGGPVVRLH